MKVVILTIDTGGDNGWEYINEHSFTVYPFRKHGMTEDGMARWHNRVDGGEFEWTPGDGDRQGGLACCDSWGRKESDTTEWLNWTELTDPWNFPSKSTGVSCHFLLQRIFPTQGSNPGLPHCRQMLYRLSHQGSCKNHTCKIQNDKRKILSKRSLHPTFPMTVSHIFLS